MVYPDPSKIPIPGMGPPKYVARVTTWNPSRVYPIHNHFAFVDRNGNGVTDEVAGHRHEIIGNEILPGRDGHSHRVTWLPAGAG